MKIAKARTIKDNVIILYCAIMDKLHSYQGFSGRFHEWRDDLKAKFANWREDHEGDNLVDLTKNIARNTGQGSDDKEDYSHIYRSGMH